MVSLHTIYVVSLVSQVTSTMALALLAWRDRQARGLGPLACGCGLHAMAVFLMPRWRDQGLWVAQSISVGSLPLMLFLFHRGMASLLGRPYRHRAIWLTVVPSLMAVCASLARHHRLWAAKTTEATAAGMLLVSVAMLWPTERGPLRTPARATALLLALLAGIFTARLLMEPPVPSTGLFLLMREVTMVGLTLLAFSFLALYLGQSQQRVYDETRRDPLTGLPNRRAIEEAAAQQLLKANRAGVPLALLMIDLDRFKQLNDTWGHVTGDRALRAVGSVLHIAADQGDHAVARMGGEEFAMLLPGHDADRAAAVAERLRAAIEGLVLPLEEQTVGFTASIGVAAWHPGETTWISMLQRADTALYQAKREGRNRIVVCDAVLDGATSPDPGSGLERRRAARSPRQVRFPRAESRGCEELDN